MTRMYLLDAIGDVRGDFLLEARQLREGRTKKGLRPRRKLLLIAAVIALSLLLVGCAVAYVLQLRDLTLGTISRESVPTYYDEEGNVIPTEASAAPRSIVSLQGANQQAYAEWSEFRKSYQPDGTAAAQMETSKGASAEALPENYRDIYSCYTSEMVVTLQNIAEKYGLNLLKKEYACTYDYEADVLLQSLHLDGVVKADWVGRCQYLHGYFFDNGSFSLPMELTEEESGETVFAEMDYVRKDCLYPYTTTVAMTQTLREWNYTTRDAVVLLLVLDGENGHIFADRADAFFHIYVDASRREMQPEDLERIAECFDYAVAPQTPSSAEVTQFFAQALKDYEASQESRQQALYSGGYGAYVARRLEQADSPYRRDNMLYSLLDLNGDGVEELIDYQALQILTLKDGQCTAYFDPLRDAPGVSGLFYFCQDGTVLIRGIFDDSYWYYRPGANGLELIQAVDEKLGSWTLYREPKHLEGERITEPEDKQAITKEEAYAIIDSYSVRDVGIQSMKRFGEPLKTYPYRDENAVFIAKMLDKYENSEDFVYTLEDLRGDGSQVLIVRIPYVADWEGNVREGSPQIYGFRNGIRGTVFSFDYLCEGGVLCQHEDDHYEFYRMEGDDFVSVEKLFVDENGYWMRRTPGQDLNTSDRLDYQVITREQAQEIIASYPETGMNWKPFALYPLQ